MQKKLIIFVTVLFIWILLLIISSFSYGSREYEKLCILSKSPYETDTSNLYGFENCDPDTLTYRSIFIGLLYIAFGVQMTLILSDEKINIKRHFIYFGIGISLSFIFVIIDQILLNSFQNIKSLYPSSPGWELKYGSGLISNLDYYKDNPQKILYLVLYIILFSFGPFLSGLLFRIWRNKLPKIVSIPMFIITVVVIQFVVVFFGSWMSFGEIVSSLF